MYTSCSFDLLQCDSLFLGPLCQNTVQNRRREELQPHRDPRGERGRDDNVRFAGRDRVEYADRHLVGIGALHLMCLFLNRHKEN